MAEHLRGWYRAGLLGRRSRTTALEFSTDSDRGSQRSLGLCRAAGPLFSERRRPLPQVRMVPRLHLPHVPVPAPAHSKPPSSKGCMRAGPKVRQAVALGGEADPSLTNLPWVRAFHVFLSFLGLPLTGTSLNLLAWTISLLHII